ncbi:MULTISPECIES: hemolysin family protein [Pseudoxanthomonas]|uniref:Hemolysin n=1 Tax=Pseudoxanthomonas winnipegensis TaxID=2480810 RepID=A0A4Q8L9J3_9GAMM|nr:MULTISPECIES: hemolysin family protein [Pseudoxanthomonas]MDQ1118570.1 putative hemolysin [Pseudoxanthomonas winnipegensis]MDQ1131754.1 putative hemolysin [Pseudoxanthomonas winnipegensis]MDR6138226.1 putative hemolysin [Pseudoxanthomonas sp. SORGH_AS_0997]RZZ82798.1 HlyC/CorC family transporter [Pseudoxanthomonas winnipegensis]TAA24911.1 HlyC/CorC family transporter [Pseudoxanthomonas winnipegensis]
MLELLTVLFLIALNAFFALSEMALMTSRKLRLKQQAIESRGARAALALAEHPDNLLSTVQIGINLIGILGGVFGGDAIGAIIAGWLDGWFPGLAQYNARIGVATAVTLITAGYVIFGELIPKRLALTNPEKIAAVVALPLTGLLRISKPIVALLGAINRAVLRLLGIKDDARQAVTEEEIRMLVSESHEQGVIDDDERNMVNRVLRLGDRTADSLMTPRKRIVWLDIAAPYEQNLQTMRQSQYSRFPVYRHNDQDVVGVLEVKSLLDRIADHSPELFTDLRKALFVSESTHAMKLLEILREEQQSLALVVDEYGEIQGMVTLSDLMNAVVGRHHQMAENPDPKALVTTRDDGSLLIDGSLSTDDLRELLGGVALPDEQEEDYYTAAGMVIEHFGRIPHVGEHFEWAGWRIEVVDLDGARVDKLLLQKLDDADDDDIVG